MWYITGESHDPTPIGLSMARVPRRSIRSADMRVLVAGFAVGVLIASCLSVLPIFFQSSSELISAVQGVWQMRDRVGVVPQQFIITGDVVGSQVALLEKSFIQTPILVTLVLLMFLVSMVKLLSSFLSGEYF